jgi:Xaa-Pro aminopeptidase
MSPDVLIYGDTERSATMRHEVPIAIGDPFLYIEAGGRRVILTNVLERDRIAAAVPDAELLLPEPLGLQELIARGLSWDAVRLEIVVRAVGEAGLRSAKVPGELPVIVADRLRAEGVELTVDDELFETRRRAKSGAERAGIGRAQAAAEAGMRTARALLARAEILDGGLQLDGAPLTAEIVRAAIRDACTVAGAAAPPDLMVVSAWSGGGHDPGSGPLPANLPIEIDLWPRDELSGCHADMTRTFVVGEVTEEVARLRDVVRDALEAARDLARPGVTGKELYDAAADVVEAAGHPTQRTRKEGEALTHGFYFSLGHGVGLEVHEAPSLSVMGHDPLVPGDVIAIEPGIEGLELGGVRYEDLLLITADGCETLTQFPYELDVTVP